MRKENITPYDLIEYMLRGVKPGRTVVSPDNFMSKNDIKKLLDYLPYMGWDREVHSGKMVFKISNWEGIKEPTLVRLSLEQIGETLIDNPEEYQNVLQDWPYLNNDLIDMAILFVEMKKGILKNLTSSDFY